MTVIENNIYFSNLLIIIEDHPVVLSHTLPSLLLYLPSLPLYVFPSVPSFPSTHLHLILIQHYRVNYHLHLIVSAPLLYVSSCTTLFSYFNLYLFSSRLLSYYTFPSICFFLFMPQYLTYHSMTFTP